MITVKKWMIDIVDECKKSEEYDDLAYILTRKATKPLKVGRIL